MSLAVGPGPERPGAEGALSVGIDVAARRGCDVVALPDDLVARPIGRVHTADELTALLDDLRPDVVAIDAPPCWAPDGGPRRCERELQQLGVSIFVTLETFPHATAIALLGRRPERGLLRDPRAKRAWRLAALGAADVDADELRTLDEVDAALCAVTGRAHLSGDAVTLGSPAEGMLTLPRALPVKDDISTR